MGLSTWAANSLKEYGLEQYVASLSQLSDKQLFGLLLAGGWPRTALRTAGSRLDLRLRGSSIALIPYPSLHP